VIVRDRLALLVAREVHGAQLGEVAQKLDRLDGATLVQRDLAQLAEVRLVVVVVVHEERARDGRAVTERQIREVRPESEDDDATSLEQRSHVDEKAVVADVAAAVLFERQVKVLETAQRLQRTEARVVAREHEQLAQLLTLANGLERRLTQAYVRLVIQRSSFHQVQMSQSWRNALQQQYQLLFIQVS